MNDGYAWWLVILGIAIGVAVVWLVAVRMPREEGDVDLAERANEAAWISDTIEHYGGVAPRALVDEVLELHAAYLAAGSASPAMPAYETDAPADEDPEVGRGAAGVPGGPEGRGSDPDDLPRWGDWR